jgi:ABC-type bacteriocin/lantibiotic exporter with double-glycine peptidase domain
MDMLNTGVASIVIGCLLCVYDNQLGFVFFPMGILMVIFGILVRDDTERLRNR